MSKSSATRPNRKSVSDRIGLRLSRGIAARDGHRCIYCTQTAAESGAALQYDHLTPRCGEHRPDLDVPRNLVLACARCNRAKSDMTLAQ